MLEIVFVLDPRQNAFFGELVEAVRDELGALGVSSTVSLDGFPEPVEGRVYALVPPHEWVALHGGETPPPELLSRTLVICAEQPGSSFFDSNEPLARGAGAGSPPSGSRSGTRRAGPRPASTSHATWTWHSWAARANAATACSPRTRRCWLGGAAGSC